MGAAAPLHSSQRRGPTGARVRPSGPLKPREGRGCPVLPTWGGPAQPPTSHRGRRAEKQWAEERWLGGRRPAGSQARGVAVGGGRPPHSQQKVLQESWWWLGSPHRGPRWQGYPRERRRGVVAVPSLGLKSRVLPEEVPGSPPQSQGPPQVHADPRVGRGTD